MAFLDEVGLIVAPALVMGSEVFLWPVSSGNYWVAQNTTEPGTLYFQPSTSHAGLFSLTTSAGSLMGRSTGDLLTGFSTGTDSITWSMFLGHMPDSTVLQDRGVALINTAGGAENAQLDIEPRGLQVLVRGACLNQVSTAYEEAMDLAVGVRDALHEYSGVSLTVTHYPGIWCENGPFFIGFDASWRPLFSANFRCWRARDGA